ncbi:hypothetical protein ACYULU_01980 [Breznakiellaceae bacterium SP9]
MAIVATKSIGALVSLRKKASLFVALFFGLAVFPLFSEEPDTKTRILFPLSYDFTRLGDQNIHSPGIGIGVMAGDDDVPFTGIHRRLFALAIYQSFFFQEELVPGISGPLHQTDFLFDGRYERHQFLAIFKSASDKPIAGGLHTLQAGIAWGYEIFRYPHLSLILGPAIGIADFGDLPVMPLPLVRFALNTEWFDASFEFLTGPNVSFTIAPERRLRLTVENRMDYYRSIADLLGSYTLWYRFFGKDHRLGDFAGIGLGLKNDSMEFNLSGHEKKTFEIQQTSVFATLDLSFLRAEAGWVFDSRILNDGKRTGSLGNGFYLSIQGMVVIDK